MKYSRRNRRSGVTPGYKMSKSLSQSIIINSKGKDRLDRESKAVLPAKNGGVGVIYVGPSVEGGDKEYVKVLTGDVDSRKPSFV
ncbi:hypothetical protein HNR77_001741 [Paenibacillus sp. JGP012]|uniref:hypothetical protein n=1 Tax=Paenibacillus sp. JGP012 TaxID=2735914 RepID=UPI001612BE0B|nr:hypothetical protein [Paenibacillus sp. JGP012]MBB6020679.1 hypothetical protein [Paenibacillus sp. JGP012]